MSDLVRVIGLIEDRMKREAADGVQRPRDKTLFEFGRLHGVQTGLDISIQIIKEVLSENESEDKPSRKRAGG